LHRTQQESKDQQTNEEGHLGIYLVARGLPCGDFRTAYRLLSKGATEGGRPSERLDACAPIVTHGAAGGSGAAMAVIA
jgi:hypothetical protein